MGLIFLFLSLAFLFAKDLCDKGSWETGFGFVFINYETYVISDDA